jgi:hypothetical protein
MPHFVVEQNTLGLLVQDTIGGQPNPFKVAIEFLDKTEGRWDRDNTKEAKGTIQQLQDSYAVLPPPGVRWYRSKYFEEAFLTFDQIAQAYGLFQATGLYGELIGYHASVFIPDANYEDPTPVYLPNSLVNEVQVPWSQWNSLPNGEHRKVEGGYTIFLVPNNKMPVSGGVLTLLHTNGFTLYTHQNLPPIWQEPVEDEPQPEPA